MTGLNIVEAFCNYKGDAYGFTPVGDFEESVYTCTVPRKMRLKNERTLVVPGKTLGEFSVTEVSMCGMPICRFTPKQG